MENRQPEVELLNTSRRGAITLSSKCKKLIKKFPSTIKEQFNPHDKNINYVIEILPNSNCKKDSYYVDLKRILPLLELVQGKLTLKFPKDKPTIIRNGKHFARNLQVTDLTIEGNNLEFGRYALCEADKLEKLTINGASVLNHCAFSKNRNLKSISITPCKNNEIMIFGQVYKPADKYDISGYKKVTMELPLLSASPWLYADVRKCHSVKPTNWIYFDLDEYKTTKGTLELRTSPKYTINTSSKFNLFVPDADTFVNSEEYMPIVNDTLKNINNKTFAELLGLEKDKVITIEVQDIYKAITKVLEKEGKALFLNEVLQAQSSAKTQKKFDWHKQQKEQDKALEEKILKR